MSNLTMADSAWNSQFPKGFDAYAAYVDGRVGDQPNYDWVTVNFPQAHHLSIALFPSDDADCLDIETGAASVSSAAAWYQRQKARGIARPCFYASASLMQSDLVPAITAAGISRSQYRLWSAHYGAGKHICGPSTCKLLSIPADGTQWADMTGTLTCDQSLLLPDFFAASPADPSPALTPQEMSRIMNALPVLSPGAADKAGEVFFVRRMQVLLNGCLLWKPVSAAVIPADGFFGPKTEDVLKAVQGAYGLAQDGVCGPATWGVLVTGSPA